MKPLLLYYGVVSLSRGLTLMLTRGLREAALTPSHGLSVKDWGAELSRDNPNFAAMRVELNGSGSFLELVQATKYTSPLRFNGKGVSFVYKNPPFVTGVQISLGDVVSRLPDLRVHCDRWIGNTHCAQARLEALGSFKLRIRFQPWITRETAAALLSGTAFSFEEETSEGIAFKGPNDLNALPGLTDYADPEVLNIGDLWLTALYPGSLKLSNIGTLFVLSYVLGMLVRYYPMQWTALIRGQIEDAALPTLAAAVELIEREFPRLALEFLSAPILNGESA